MGLHSEAQLDRRYIEMVRLLNVYLNHFPRSEKYGLALMIRRGHARRTASRRHMIHHIKEHHHALYRQLPESVRRHHHLPARHA